MKYNIDIIHELAKEQGWAVKDDKYKNLDTEMHFVCPEGHSVFLPFKKVRDKWVCPICSANKYKEPDHKVVAKKSGTKRVIALDQASRFTGYSIFDNSQLVDYGVFETELEDEVARYNMIKMWLVSMIHNWKPDYIAIEGIQYQQNFGVTVFQMLARLQGVLLECCYELGIPCEVCATNTWRHSCGVKGKSRTDKKRSMQLLVKEWYDISVSEDAADAIGIGRYMADNFLKRNEIVEWE